MPQGNLPRAALSWSLAPLPLPSRLKVPDRKGKAAVPAEGDSHPEQRMLEALKQAMQLSPAAGDAVLRELRALQGEARAGMTRAMVRHSTYQQTHQRVPASWRLLLQSCLRTQPPTCLPTLQSCWSLCSCHLQSLRRTASWTSGCCWRLARWARSARRRQRWPSSERRGVCKP